jgi:hypothetical protein
MACTCRHFRQTVSAPRHQLTDTLLNLSPVTIRIQDVCPPKEAKFRGNGMSTEINISAWFEL